MNNQERRDSGMAYIADEDKKKLYKNEAIDDEAWEIICNHNEIPI